MVFNRNKLWIKLKQSFNTLFNIINTIILIVWSLFKSCENGHFTTIYNFFDTKFYDIKIKKDYIKSLF